MEQLDHYWQLALDYTIYLCTKIFIGNIIFDNRSSDNFISYENA